MVTYADLPDGAQDVIATTKQRFMDCFDSDDFGPFILEFKRFDNDRLAVLLDIAIGQLLMYVNVPGLPWNAKDFPYSNDVFRQAAILALTIEVINHLVRSYTEIPDTTAVGAPEVRRRDYQTRWSGILRDYQDQLKQMAKRLTAEAYNAQASSGAYMQTLIGFPPNGIMWPSGYAEKGGYWGWF